jgi:hypothetical protein
LRGFSKDLHIWREDPILNGRFFGRARDGDSGTGEAFSPDYRGDITVSGMSRRDIVGTRSPPRFASTIGRDVPREMARMAVDWYVIWFVLGPDIGFLFVVGAIPFAIYSFCVRNQRRGLIASRIALVLSLLSVLVSALLWITLISGQYRYGQPVDYHDGMIVVLKAIAFLEAFALLISILSAVRQIARPTS